jgi:hypothetical protein
MEAVCSSETSVITWSTRCHIPEDGFLRSHRREKPQILRNINRLDSVVEMQCVSSEIRTGFYIPETTFFIVTAVKNLKS